MSEPIKTDVERDWMARAEKVLPAGGFGNYASDVVIREGKGGRVWDESGNEYVDYLLGSGPMMVGHCHPEVVAAVEDQLTRGTTFFTNNAKGIELAEEIVATMACADQVRFVSTGSEADMYAMRLARAHSGREKILKFEGGYHGMSDHALMSLAPKRLTNFPQPVPDSAGIPSRVQDEVVVGPFNDTDTVRGMIQEYAKELGGVIVEPLQRLIPPAPGFLEMLREETEKHHIPLIFDEVVTGFRLAYGGAQELYGITPDLCTLGKVIGGGFPLAAIAGKREIMAHFDKNAVAEDAFTFQIGTLSGNPMASAAGLATMAILKREGAYDRMFRTGETIMAALRDNFARVGIPARVVGHPILFDVVFTEADVTDYRGVLGGDAGRMKHFNTLMLERGILKPDSKFYIGLAQNDDDVAQTVGAIKEAADVMAAA